MHELESRIRSLDKCLLTSDDEDSAGDDNSISKEDVRYISNFSVLVCCLYNGFGS